MLFTSLLTLLYAAIALIKRILPYAPFVGTLLLCLAMPGKSSAQWAKIQSLPGEKFFALTREGARAYAATAERIYVSDDGGQTWKATQAIHGNLDDEVTDILAHEGCIYVATLLNGCYISADGGNTWKQHNLGITGMGAVNHASLAIRGDSIYVGTIGAGVFVKPLYPIFAGWSAFNKNIPWGNIQCLASDGDWLIAGAGGNATMSLNKRGDASWLERPFDGFNGEMNIFLAARRSGQGWVAAGTQGMYSSTDAMGQWVKSHHGLGFIEQAKLEHWQGRDLAALTKPNGSFLLESSDHGQHWSNFQPALPNGAFNYDLLALGNRLICARSNGLWLLESTVPVNEPQGNDFEMGQIFPNPASGNSAFVPFVSGIEAEAIWVLYDLQGKAVRRQWGGRVSPGRHTLELDLSGLAEGHYVCQLWLGGRVQSRRLTLMGIGER